DALYHKALHISNVINDNTNNQDIILNICWNFLDENKYEKVTPYLNSLLSFQPKENQKDFSLGDYVFISDLNFVIGRYYGEIGEYKLAHEHFEKAISIAENNDLYEELNQAAKANAKYYQKEGDFESALSNTQKYIISKERLLDKNLLQKLQVEKAKYSVNEYERALEVSEKEKKLADSIASSKNKLSWLYLVVCVILAIFLVIIFLSNRKRKKLIKSLNHKNKQLVKAQKEAEEAADIKANFISNVSHELRTPLHGVIGITSLLLAEKDISKNNRKLLKSLKFSGDYLLGLINNVLLMSKIDNGKLQIKPYLIKVENLVSTIRSGIEFSAKKKEVEISFVIEPEVPEKVILDSNIVSEILINLIENAIKFSKGGKVITKIEVNNTYPITSEDLTLRFTVEDNGTGIPENKKEIIFNKFSQVALERNMLEGTGIGLSLVKSLLLHLGSDIKLETEMGVGSKFYFDLKCKLSEEVEIRPTIAKENLKFLYENKKILLVEDNEINMMVTKKFLSPYQIDLEIISDGKEAYEALLKNHYDLILLDINIPSMSGYEISKKIREKGIEVPIVAVTASELSEIEEKAYGLGMDDIIIKPFQKQKLIQTLSKFFND
ncbi:response regulator, partial [Mesonia sp.]|uniref:response regulator n=1 Tax=Mesonia sp. TaxID=1960830 RepID=UPI0025C472CF